MPTASFAFAFKALLQLLQSPDDLDLGPKDAEVRRRVRVYV